MHPRVRARTAELAAAAPPDAIVVNDVPLLVEGGLAPRTTWSWSSTRRREARIERLVRDRGMTTRGRGGPDRRADRRRHPAGGRRRGARQRRHAGRRWRAAVDALWPDRLLPFEENLRGRPVVRQGSAGDAGRLRPDAGRRSTSGWSPGSGVGSARAGSTTSARPRCPACRAKDVIDLMLAVDSLAEADGLAEPLAGGRLPAQAGRLPGPAEAARTPGRGRSGCTAAPTRAARSTCTSGWPGSPGWRYGAADARPPAGRPRRARRVRRGSSGPTRAGRSTTTWTRKEPCFDELYARAPSLGGPHRLAPRRLTELAGGQVRAPCRRPGRAGRRCRPGYAPPAA